MRALIFHITVWTYLRGNISNAICLVDRWRVYTWPPVICGTNLFPVSWYIFFRLVILFFSSTSGPKPLLGQLIAIEISITIASRCRRRVRLSSTMSVRFLIFSPGSLPGFELPESLFFYNQTEVNHFQSGSILLSYVWHDGRVTLLFLLPMWCLTRALFGKGEIVTGGLVMTTPPNSSRAMPTSLARNTVDVDVYV